VVEVGVHLPHFGPLATPATLQRVVTTCERAGFDAVWVGDHVALPVEVASRYPYHESGSASFDAASPFYDPFVVLSFAAAWTTRLRLGLSVLVVPLRHPLVTLKLVSSLDALAGGRTVVGVGAGWLREEFDALGLDFDARGRVTDEYLEVLARGFRHSPLAFSGEHVAFPPVGVAPLPPAPPPLWVGGHTRAALRRALRVGDGWQAVADTPEQMAALTAQLVETAGGALPDGFAVSTRVHLPRFDPDADDDAPFGPATARARVEAYAAAGATHLVVDLWDRDLGRYVARLEALAEWLDLPSRSTP